MLTNLARKLVPVVVSEQIGTVVSVDGAETLVRVGDDRLIAKRAVSCLVEPMVDDEVLVGVRSDGRCNVLAVLEREPGAGLVIAPDADLSLRVRGGRFTVAAQEGVDLVTAKELRVTAARVGVVAPDADVTVQRMTYVGRLLDAQLDRIKSVATTIDSVADRLSQRVKRSFRRVEELDSVRAAKIDIVASESLRTHAQNQLMTAQELIKLDGEQIHLG